MSIIEDIFDYHYAMLFKVKNINVRIFNNVIFAILFLVVPYDLHSKILQIARHFYSGNEQ